MKPFLTSVCISLSLSFFLVGEEPLGAVATASETSSEPTEFREIGLFQVSKGVLTKLGKTTEITKSPLILRVFSDGIDIRISPDGQDQDFLAFQIYRTADIFDADGVDAIPGVQAFSDQGEVVRHLVVNSRLLTLTKFPTSTNDVEIIYATRYER